MPALKNALPFATEAIKFKNTLPYAKKLVADIPHTKVAPETLFNLKKLHTPDSTLDYNQLRKDYFLKNRGMKNELSPVRAYEKGPNMKKVSSELVKTAFDLGKALPYLLGGAGLTAGGLGLYNAFKPDPWYTKIFDAVKNLPSNATARPFLNLVDEIPERLPMIMNQIQGGHAGSVAPNGIPGLTYPQRPGMQDTDPNLSTPLYEDNQYTPTDQIGIQGNPFMM